MQKQLNHLFLAKNHQYLKSQTGHEILLQRSVQASTNKLVWSTENPNPIKSRKLQCSSKIAKWHQDLNADI